MKAIVYTSQTGHTQRYAQMLAERTGVPAYSLKEAGKSLRRGEEIFYMGWLMAGTVKGLQSAMDRYTIRGAAIVGVSPQGNGDLWTEARINGGYSDSGGRLFYLQGGYAPEKLGFFYRMMMKPMAGSVVRQVQARGEAATDQERRMAEIFQHGGDFVREEALDEIEAAIKEEEKEDAEKKEPAFTFDNPSGDNIFLPVSANSGDGENCLVYTVAYEEDGSHKIELLYEVVLDETGKIARRDRSGEVEWNCIAYQTGEGWKAAKGEE